VVNKKKPRLSAKVMNEAIADVLQHENREKDARKRAIPDSLLARATLSDIESIELDNGCDEVTIKLMVPVADGAYAEYEESLPLDDELKSSKLHRMAREFSTELLLAVQQRRAQDRPVPCTTCLGACCYKYEEVRLTEEDVSRLVSGLGEKRAAEGYTRYQSGTRWTGYVASLTKKARSINGQQIATACHFLRGDGCSIYEHRPTVCREYSAWTCQDTYEADPAKVKGKVRLRVIA
jgi:Fe-S-cluster containining protein